MTGPWPWWNSARAGLTGYVAGTSRQVADKGVTINNLLPGIHDTDRAKALDTGWTEPLHDTLHSILVGYSVNSISDLARRTVAVAETLRGGPAAAGEQRGAG